MGVEPSQKRCLLEVVSKHHGPKHIEVVSRKWSDLFFYEGGKLPAHFLGWGRVVVVVAVAVGVVFDSSCYCCSCSCSSSSSSLFIGSTPEVFFNFFWLCAIDVVTPKAMKAVNSRDLWQENIYFCPWRAYLCMGHVPWGLLEKKN